jgi:hypothetical protein
MSCARCEEWQRICENLESQITGLREDTANRIEALEAALREIARGEGRFSRDPYEHACNTIEDLIAIAKAALAPEQDK